MQPKPPLSAAALDSLMSGLEVDFIKLVECLVSRKWRLLLAANDAPGIHYCLSGTGRMIVGDDPPIAFTTHTLMVTPPRKAFKIEAIAAQDTDVIVGTVDSSSLNFPAGSVQRLVAGGAREPDIVMICGYFRASYRASVDLFAALPAPIVETFTAADQLDHKLKAALEVLMAEEIGSGAMSMALLKQVLITLLRRSVTSADRWAERFVALSDPKIARAFSAMVARPGAPHSTQTLADTAGLSRSAFMSRFTAAFGDSPMTILRQLRMRRARALLGTRNLTTDRVAAAVGYSSRSSFQRAFQKAYGKAPPD